MNKKVKIYLSYLSNDEKSKMTDAMDFLRSCDKRSKEDFLRIAHDLYATGADFDFPMDNGHRPSEGSCKSFDKVYYTIVQFEQKSLTQQAIDALGVGSSFEWRYYYAISLGGKDREMYLVSFSDRCRPNWNNEYRLQHIMKLQDVDFPILKNSHFVYRIEDSMHAAINGFALRGQSFFVERNGNVRITIRDQHGNYSEIKGLTLDDVFRNYADNYTGYRNYRRQMASEWEIADDVARQKFKLWKETATGLKSDFDKFYGGGIVD